MTDSLRDSHHLQGYHKEALNEDIELAMLSLKQFSESDDCSAP